MGTQREAREFACLAHGGQTYGGQLYWVHLAAVRNVLIEYGFTGPIVTAAWLHDTLEDTSTTPEEISRAFGADVLAYVWAVTGEGRTRKDRNASVYQKLRANVSAVPLKLADRIANVEASKDDPKHLALYRSEHPGFREALGGLGPPEMWERLEKALTANG
jgi:(p)ppGpp synthase/HD superfamily hydrolase